MEKETKSQEPQHKPTRAELDRDIDERLEAFIATLRANFGSQGTIAKGLDWEEVS